MSRPRLLLVPFVTELEWETIEPLLAKWAEVGTFDPPGVGVEPLPAELSEPAQSWAAAGTSTSWSPTATGSSPAVQLARRDRDRVRGLALGHAALSHDREGPRAPTSNEIWEVMTTLMRTDTTGFIAYGIAQLTQGAVSDEQASRWIDRFPDRALVTAIWELLGSEPEPVGEELHELGLPLLLAQHIGCLAETQEGYDDIVAEFPDAATVGCPEACAASPVFAEALREFCQAPG